MKGTDILSDQQIIRVDPARVDDIRSYASDIGLVLLFRRLIIAPDHETTDNQMAPSAAVSLPWELVVPLRDMLDSEISQHEERNGETIKGAEVHTAPRIN